jgi:hypothetical protein
MRGLRHPYSHHLYELGDRDGEVIVTDDRDPGAVRRGTYDTRGNWLSGEQLRVCPNMCIWVGEGPRVTPPLSTHRRFMNVRSDGAGVAAE